MKNAILLSISTAAILLTGCSGYQAIKPPTEMVLSSQGEIFAAPFSCTADPKASTQPVRRLLRAEYLNTVENMFGGSLPAGVKAALDTVSEYIPNDGPASFSFMIDQSQMDTLEQVATQVLMQISNTPALVTTLGGACLTAGTVTDTCRTTVINALGLKALRRPLLADEVTKLRNVLAMGMTPGESMGYLVYALLLSPDFMFQLPIGEASGSVQQSRVKLNAYQVASRLSYFLWDAPPDATLMAAAARDELQTVLQVEAQADRMLNMPKAKEKMHRFFQTWLRYKSFGADKYSSSFVDGLNITALNEEGLREINEFIDYTIWGKSGTFRDLLTSRESFARNRELASVYGHTPVTNGTPALMPADRRGILTRLPVLMSEGNETRPIHRGVPLRNNVFCEQLGAPVGVNLDDSAFFTDTARLTGSTRQRTAEMTKATQCQTCHSRINDLGFVFENFDSLGRLRAVEKMYNSAGEQIAQHPVDTKVDLHMGSEVMRTNDSTDLVEQMVNAPTAPACFARQVYRFFNFKMESGMDSCVLKEVFSQLDGADQTLGTQSLRNAFKKFVANEAFLYRAN